MFIIGFAKKVLLADSVTRVAEAVFAAEAPSTLDVWYGAVAYAFGLYLDFSAYSEMAIGVGLMLGLECARNFNAPYLADSITDFWRRWHISLCSWFRDYLYIPLGGSRGGTIAKIRNTFAIFVVSGFWHGANWTFIVWGALNDIYFLPLILSNKNRDNLEIPLPGPTPLDADRPAVTAGADGGQ